MFVLQDLNRSTQQHQPVINNLQKEVVSLASRGSYSPTHTPYNIGLLEEEVTAIKQRWDNVCRQVSERYHVITDHVVRKELI
jgi:hypothetical protein